MLLEAVALCSEAVAATGSRRQKVALIAELLASARRDESRIAVAYLSGAPRQRRLGIAWAALSRSFEPAAAARLELVEVDRVLGELEAVSGPGAAATRTAVLGELMESVTAKEQRFLRGLIAGELRQGALQALVLEAVARAAGVPLATLRRAAMLAGDPAEASGVALEEGESGLRRIHLTLGRPVQPMLAKTAASVGDALSRLGEAAVEWKLDGVRIQVHRDGERVRVFSRTLEPIEERVPEVVEATLRLPARRLILDGELIALHPDGRPRPFQETSSRVAFRGDPASLRDTIPLTPFFFDLLHLDGEDLIDLPTRERIRRSSALLPEGSRVPRAITALLGEAETFLAGAIRVGHEGVVLKSLDAPYAAGRRGEGWIKVKPRLTLDLVVLAAEWGHGRRQGLLSNLHLGASDGSGGFVMLGKTFKGLSDEVLRWQTEALLQLEVARRGITVFVEPRLVVEVAFDGLQTSPRYPGGVALRFARVIRYREDKRPADADTLDGLLELRRT